MKKPFLLCHKPCITLFAALLSLSAFCQSVAGISEELEGSPTALLTNNSSAMEATGNYNSKANSIIYTGPTETVFSLYKAKGNQQQVVKMNSSMKILWKTPCDEDETIISISKFKDNIIVFTVDDMQKRNRSITKEIKATLLNINNGKVLVKKSVFENKSDHSIGIKWNLDDTKSLRSMLIRYTEAEKESYMITGKEYEKKSKTQKIELLTFDDKLNVASTRTITTNLGDMEFLGCVYNNKDELFFAACSDNSIVVEKFGKDASSPSGKLTASVSEMKNERKTGEIAISSNNTDAVLLSLKARNKDKDKNFIAAYFDFAANKASVHEDVLAKAYRKEIGVKNADEFISGPLMTYGDKIIICKEVQYTFSAGGSNQMANRYYAEEILVSVYDNRMNIVKEFIIPRRYEAFLRNQRDAGYWIQKNNLVVLYTKNDGMLKYSTGMAVIALDKLLMEKDIVLERGEIKSTPTIEAPAALWFGSSVILPYIQDKGVFIKSENTVFQKINF